MITSFDFYSDKVPPSLIKFTKIEENVPAGPGSPGFLNSLHFMRFTEVNVADRDQKKEPFKPQQTHRNSF